MGICKSGFWYDKPYRKNYLVYFIPTLLCFILALDHGRNISLISCHLVAFYLTLLIDTKTSFLIDIKTRSKNAEKTL